MRLGAWFSYVSIATTHLMQAGRYAEGPEVHEMERSLGEKKLSTKLDTGEEHSATINIAFLQAVEKRKPNTKYHRAIHR